MTDFPISGERGSAVVGVDVMEGSAPFAADSVVTGWAGGFVSADGRLGEAERDGSTTSIV